MVKAATNNRLHSRRVSLVKLVATALIAQLLFVALAGIVYPETKGIPDKPKNYLCVDVNDALYIVDEGKIAALCSDFAKKHNAEIVVYVDDRLATDNLESFTDRLAKNWSLGMYNQGSWIVVAIFTEQRELRIACSPNLDNKLTHYRCTYVIDNIIAPRFRQNDYAGGIGECIDALGLQMEGKFRIPWSYRFKHALGGEDETAGWLLLLIIGAIVLVVSSISDQYRRRAMGDDYYKFDVISADGTIGTGDIRTSYDRPDDYYDDGYYGGHSHSGGGGSSGGGGGGATGGW